MKQVDTVIHHLKIGYFKESISFYLHFHIHIHVYVKITLLLNYDDCIYKQKMCFVLSCPDTSISTAKTCHYLNMY